MQLHTNNFGGNNNIVKQHMSATNVHQQQQNHPPPTSNHAPNGNMHNIPGSNVANTIQNDCKAFSNINHLNNISNINNQKAPQTQPTAAVNNHLQGPAATAANLLFVRPANPPLHVGKLPFLPVQFL